MNIDRNIGSQRFAVQVPPTLYVEDYDTAERYLSYWHQVLEATKLGGRVLEVGIGNGTVSAVLRARGIDLVTLDFDRELGPDVVADVRSLPFEDDSFDGALACEVLEHLPWGDLPQALGELRRVLMRWLLVSVPSVGPAATLQAWLPNGLHIVRMMLRRQWALRDGLWALSQRPAWRRDGGKLARMGTVPPLLERPHVFNGEHYWVLGEDGVTADDFRRLVLECQLRVVHDFRPVEAPWHHFFLLEKT